MRTNRLAQHCRWIVALALLLIPLQRDLWGQTQGRGSYAPGDVPNVQLQDSMRFVSDPEDYIPSVEEDAINEQLARLRQQYHVQCAVVVLPSTEEDIESFSTELFRLWGLGDRQANDGLLFVLAIEDRRSRFEVGYGLEGYLTDAETSSIWRKDMRTLVGKSHYGEAILRGMLSVEQSLERQAYEPGKSASATEEGIDWSFVLYAYLGFSALAFCFVFFNLKTESRMRIADSVEARRRYVRLSGDYHKGLHFLLVLCLPLGLLFWALRRYLLGHIEHLAGYCPHCAAYGLMQQTPSRLTPLQQLEERIGVSKYITYTCSRCQRGEQVRSPRGGLLTSYRYCPSCGGQTSYLVQSRQYRSPKDHLLYKRNTYRCLHCHHEFTDDELDKTGNDEERLTSAGAGMIIGSMLGGRGGYSSGGWSGGSWGGGSSGGGGFTGSW